MCCERARRAASEVPALRTVGRRDKMFIGNDDVSDDVALLGAVRPSDCRRAVTRPTALLVRIVAESIKK